MTMIGWNHFEHIPKQVISDRRFWWSFLQRNFDSVLNILVELSKDLHCIVCGNLSTNFTSKGSLASHIRYHRTESLNYYLDNVIQKTPDELEELIE